MMGKHSTFTWADKDNDIHVRVEVDLLKSTGHPPIDFGKIVQSNIRDILCAAEKLPR